MANTDLIDTVFSRITAENLEMAHWARAEVEDGVSTGTVTPPASCNTTMCFAGHTVVAAGDTIKWEPRDRWNPITGRYEIYRWVADFTTEGVPIEDRAQQLLELSTNEAHAIFYAADIGSDVDRLRTHVDRVLLNGGEYFDFDEDDEEYWEDEEGEDYLRGARD